MPEAVIRLQRGHCIISVPGDITITSRNPEDGTICLFPNSLGSEETNRALQVLDGLALAQIWYDEEGSVSLFNHKTREKVRIGGCDFAPGSEPTIKAVLPRAIIKRDSQNFLKFREAESGSRYSLRHFIRC